MPWRARSTTSPRLRVYFPEYARELARAPSFAALPRAVRARYHRASCTTASASCFPEITEDSMPGELANCIAGRIANLFNFHGPNYVCDAACARPWLPSARAVEGWLQNDFDAVVTGGIDRNMGASTFVKFCKIGALSGTGTRPYAEGADGFVMGEGAAIFLMKRLADAERDGDKIYAVLRGIGGSSDGKGKGITAPNPIGQKFCDRARWENAGLSPATATLIEGHGTSTRVGDVVEVAEHGRCARGRQSPAARVALGLREIQHRAFERRSRRGRNAESDAGAARQGAAAQRELRASQSGYRLRPLAALRQYRTAAVDATADGVATRRRQRVRLRRHQLPWCMEEYVPAPAHRQRQAFGECVDRCRQLRRAAACKLHRAPAFCTPASRPCAERC